MIGFIWVYHHLVGCIRVYDWVYDSSSWNIGKSWGYRPGHPWIPWLPPPVLRRQNSLREQPTVHNLSEGRMIQEIWYSASHFHEVMLHIPDDTCRSSKLNALSENGRDSLPGLKVITIKAHSPNLIWKPYSRSMLPCRLSTVDTVPAFETSG